jgi:hypothetical protein
MRVLDDATATHSAVLSEVVLKVLFPGLIGEIGDVQVALVFLPCLVG